MESDMTLLKSFIRDETGATAIEYALIAAATGLALAAVMPDIGTKLIGAYNSVSTKL
jgi:pilus assembly protein Flp/PilA